MYNRSILNLYRTYVTNKHVIHFFIDFFSIFFENSTMSIDIMIADDIFEPLRNFWK